MLCNFFWHPAGWNICLASCFISRELRSARKDRWRVIFLLIKTRLVFTPRSGDPFFCPIIIIICLHLVSQRMISHWSLSDNKSPQLSRTLIYQFVYELRLVVFIQIWLRAILVSSPGPHLVFKLIWNLLWPMYFLWDLKATQMNVVHSLIWKPVGYKFGLDHNAAKATKTFGVLKVI